MKDSKFQMSKSCVYQILIFKPMKTKKYLGKNFRKEFISFNFAFYISSILSVVKLNESFYFSIEYCKLNIIIKRNRYSISFVEKAFVKVMNCKYLTKLNIIAILKKLHIYLNSEDLIVFIMLFFLISRMSQLVINII